MHAFKSEQTFCREENFVGDIEVNFPGWSSFSFSTKMKRSILLNITFLSASSNSTLVILLREKKTIYCLHGRWFLFMRKKSSCINYSVNTMTSCTRNLARAPYPQLSDGEYRGRIVRHQRLKTEPMLLRGLYNYLNKWTICDSIRFSIEEENFELVSAMLRRGVKKSFTLMTDDVERTIPLITIYALLLSIRRIDFSNFAD